MCKVRNNGDGPRIAGTVPNFLIVLIRISISCLLLVFLFLQVDKPRMLAIFSNSRKGFLVAAVMAILAVDTLAFLRWKILLNAQGVKAGLLRSVSAFCGGLFFNMLLPSTIGGDIIRAADVAFHTRKRSQSAAAVLLDRLSGFVALTFLMWIAVFFAVKFVPDRGIFVLVGLVTLMLFTALVVIFNPRVFAWANRLFSKRKQATPSLLQDIHTQMHLLRENKKAILLSLAISLVIQAVSPLANFFIAKALQVDLAFVYFLIFMPLIGIIALLPVSIAGLGLRDASFVVLFAKIGVAKDAAFSMSLMFFFVLLCIAAAGGVFYVFTLHNRRLQPA